MGLYKVIKAIRLVNYKVKLLRKIKIYLVFYISLLELALKGSEVLYEPTDLKEEEE